MDMVVYYDSHPGGLRAMRLKGDEGTDWYSLFHQEAKHRGIKVPSFMACEPVSDALKAKQAAGLPVLDFIAQRVSKLTESGIKVFVDAGAPKDECVMVSRNANGDIYDAMRLAIEGLRDVRPTETPFFMASRRIGKSAFAQMYAEAIAKDRADFKPVAVVHDEIQYELEAPNNTPPGLLCVSPMDGRLGNRWSPE